MTRRDLHVEHLLTGKQFSEQKETVRIQKHHLRHNKLGNRTSFIKRLYGMKSTVPDNIPPKCGLVNRPGALESNTSHGGGSSPLPFTLSHFPPGYRACSSVEPHAYLHNLAPVRFVRHGIAPVVYLGERLVSTAVKLELEHVYCVLRPHHAVGTSLRALHFRLRELAHQREYKEAARLERLLVHRDRLSVHGVRHARED